MSNISDRYVLEVFTSGKSKALDGQRLAVVSYKLTKDDKAKGLTERSRVSTCASVPKVTSISTEQLAVFQPYVLAMIEDTQDKIVRVFVDAGVATIGDSDISIDAVLAYLEDESKGSRLTKEIVTEWFDASLADCLAVAFADKMGMSDTPSAEETKKLEQQINVYREKLASMAGGKTTFPPEVAMKLVKALEFASNDDVMAQRFVARLNKMKEVPSADMLGL